MSGLNFNITANDSDFRRKLQEVDASVSKTTKSIEASGQSVESYFRKMTAGAAALAAGFSARELISNIVRTRGEMQQLEVAFTTMLQSGERASSLLADSVEFAAKTPFDLQGVAGGIRQLLAYGTAAEDAIETVEMLGNVSAGLSVPLNDMIYLYGTLRAQGRAMTVDIRQFAGRGVPIYEELAKVLGVTRQEVSALITEGKVGFPEVEQAFRNMTSEGGMFYNLMREQSKTITGQISNLQDSISQMFNAIGQQSEGVIASAISGLSWMVEHYRELAQVLGVIVAAYGSYRAALIAVNAAQAIAVSAKNISAFISLARGITSARDAMTLLNIAFKANPIGLIVSGITTLITVLLTLRKRSKEAAEAADQARQAIADETAEVNRLVKSLTDSNTGEDERREILAKLREIAPDVVSGIDEENISLQELNTSLEEYNELRRAEAAIKGYSFDVGLDKAVKDMNAAKEDMESQKTEILSLWTNLASRINNIRLENDSLPKSIEKVFDTVMSDDLSIEDKLSELRDAFDYERLVTKNEPALEIFREIFKGFYDELNDYDKALDSLRSSEFEYADAKEKVQQRIEATAKAMTEDLEKQQEIIESLNKAFFPEDFQNAGGGNGDGDGTGILAVDFETQVREAKARIDEAKKALEDLKAGIIPEASKNDAAFNFAAAIKEQEKVIKAAQDEYNTLIGYDPKQAEMERNARLKAKEDADNAVIKATEDAERAEYELAKKGVDDRIKLLEMERDRELAVIRERIGAAQSQSERDSLQRLYDATEGIYNADIKSEMDNQSKVYNDYLNKLLSETATYQQARLDIEADFAEKRRAMYADEEMTVFRDGFTQGNRDNLDSQEQEALDELDRNFAMRSEKFVAWADSIADAGIDKLRSMLEQASALLAQISPADSSSDGGAESMDEYSDKAVQARAAVTMLTEAIDSFNRKQEESDGDTEKSAANWTELLGVLRDASSTFTELGSAIGGSAGELLSSIGSLSSAAISMAAGIKAAATAVSALEKASAILAVISAAIQVVSFFASAAKENEEANLAAARAAMEYSIALKELAYSKRLAASETIFGTDEIRSLGVYSDLLRETKDDIVDTYKKLYGLGYMEDGIFGGDEFSLLKAGYSLDGGKLISDLRSGWQKFWGTGKDNVESFDLSGIIDEAGNIDADKMEDLRAWYEQYGEGLDEDHRIMVDNMLSDWDMYKEALDGIMEFANSLFGDIASDVADAILSGSDNLEAEMDEILLNVKQKVAKVMLESMILTDVFNNELQDQIIDAIKNGDIALANQLFENGMDELRDLLPEYKEFAESVGAIDSSSQSSVSDKGTVMSGVSQDSFDVFTGTLMNMQTHTFSINKNVMSMAANSDRVIQILSDISGDTNLLRSISSNISSLKTSVLDIISKGIKVK